VFDFFVVVEITFSNLMNVIKNLRTHPHHNSKLLFEMIDEFKVLTKTQTETTQCYRFSWSIGDMPPLQVRLL
jgi:hypothetical protein